MFKFMTVLAVFFLSAGMVMCQTEYNSLLDYLTLPDPDCSFNWEMSASSVDPLRSNAKANLAPFEVRLHEAQMEGNNLLIGRLMLNLAAVYGYLDSSYIAKQYNDKALVVLKSEYSSKQTAECAYLLGLFYSKNDKSDSAQIWLEQAIKLDPDYYQAYFDIVSNGTTLDTSQIFWIERSAVLAKRLINSDRPKSVRADVAFQYAWMQIGLYIENKTLDLFRNMLNDPSIASDTSNLENLGKEFFLDISSSLCGPEIVDLFSKAANLDPSKTHHRLAFLATQLGQIFFSMADDLLAKPDDESQEGIDLMGQYFESKHDFVFQIRTDLDLFTEAEKHHFPSVYYYLAVADYMLGDYRQAYEDIYTFNRLNPDNSHGYGLYCGIVTVMLKLNPEENSALLDEFVALCRAKCELYPTAQDCYRVGVISAYSGDPALAIQLFESAMLEDGKDIRPKIGVAVCSYIIGDAKKSGTVVNSLQKHEKDLGGQDLVSYAILRAVRYADDGNLESAIYWAQKAVDADAGVPDAQKLLNLLKSMR